MPAPGVRRKARERALQFLFGLEFTGETGDVEALERFWQMAPSRPGAKEYAATLACGVCAERAALDQEIDGALQHWTPERVGRLERNVLRIAVYEMRHMPDVPAAVAINEAIELAKLYGTDDAPRFVNGVLDRLRPGRIKDEE